MLDRAIVGLVLVALLFGLACFCMGAIKFNEDEELELDDDEWEMLEETVRENYEDYVE